MACCRLLPAAAPGREGPAADCSRPLLLAASAAAGPALLERGREGERTGGEEGRGRCGARHERVGGEGWAAGNSGEERWRGSKRWPNRNLPYTLKSVTRLFGPVWTLGIFRDGLHRIGTSVNQLTKAGILKMTALTEVVSITVFVNEK